MNSAVEILCCSGISNECKLLGNNTCFRCCLNIFKITISMIICDVSSQKDAFFMRIQVFRISRIQTKEEDLLTHAKFSYLYNMPQQFFQMQLDAIDETLICSPLKTFKMQTI
jgi:hypothetical protein